IVVHNDTHIGKLTVDTRDVTQFLVQDADIVSVVQAGKNPTMLWTAPNPVSEFAFKVPDLVSAKGMTLDATNSSPFEALNLDFTASRLGFARQVVAPTAYYTFDSVSGTTVKDQTGGHDGTLVGGAKVATAADLGIDVRPHSDAANKVLSLDGST